ncbi:hypothetical protein AB1484_05985 [Parafrankia sp. FMc6]|uniref:hypothetical protein n=1 Tax=Parafrankia soli TaxID=2599596 RepID=UPI0034D60AE5
MARRPDDETLTVRELRDAVDIDALRTLLGRGSRRGERVNRSTANYYASRKGFPDPLLDHPRLRLWRRSDVERWLDLNRPNWRQH